LSAAVEKVADCGVVVLVVVFLVVLTSMPTAADAGLAMNNSNAAARSRPQRGRLSALASTPST
jgi:hypothetical protein